MGGDRGISSRSCQILTIFEGNVLASTVLVTLGETKVNDEDLVTVRFRGPNEEVIRFDISMDDSFGMNFLEMVHELDSDHEHCLGVDLALT